MQQTHEAELESWYLGTTINEKKPDVTFLLTPKDYPEPLRFPNMRVVIFHNKPKQKPAAPIEKLIKDYQDLDVLYHNNENHNHPKRGLSIEIVRRECFLRKIIRRVLASLSEADLLALLNARLSSGMTVKGGLAKNFLLPDKYLESTKLREADVAVDLGLLINLPVEIRRLIFTELNINEARSIVRVSKSWYKAITDHEVWRVKTQSPNPYLSLLRKEFYTKFMKRKVFLKSTAEVEVVDGEGLLVCESNYAQSIKLNGKRLAAAWSDGEGSLGRCLVWSRRLDRNEIESIVKNTESVLNEGTLDLFNLTETFGPFMRCLANGKYKLEVCKLDVDIVELHSEEDLEEPWRSYLYAQTIYCTQPSDLLNKERVAYYEEIIQKGERPAVLLFMCGPDSFLIDGHHKLKAYRNLNLKHEAVLVNIVPQKSAIVRLTHEEELAYVEHSPDGLANYNEAWQEPGPDENDDE